MYQIVSTEIIILLSSFLIFYKFRFEKKFICFLFKKVVIYLPLTDKDFEQLIQVKKEKNKNIKGIVRSCEIEEYVDKAQNEKFFKFDFIVIFYLCNLTTVFFNEIKNIILSVFFKEDVITVNTFNIISSFVLISFCYFVYMNLRFHIFKEGFSKSKEVKSFYENFIISFTLFFIIQKMNENFFNINYTSVLEIVNDRIYSILSHFEFSFKNEKNLVSKTLIQIFFSFIFGIFISILFRPAMRFAYFDHFLLMVCENPEDEKIRVSKLELFIKFKSVINIFSLFLLLDPLTNYIFDNFTLIKPYSNVIIFLSLFINYILELICGINEIWYVAFMFHAQNYNEIVNFSKNPSKDKLLIHRNYINSVNSRFWEIISHIFYLVFIPILILISLYSRANIIQTLIFHKQIELKKYFLEIILYIVLLSFAIAKGVIENGFLFYVILMNIVHVPLY